jgi:Flp pilus assembly protein TadD
VDFLRRLSGSGPSAATLTKQTVAHAENGELEKAIHDSSAAIELEPQDAELRIGRDQAFRDMGDEERAIRDVSEALI